MHIGTRGAREVLVIISGGLRAPHRLAGAARILCRKAGHSGATAAETVTAVRDHILGKVQCHP